MTNLLAVQLYSSNLWQLSIINNDIKQLAIDEKREIERILAVISEKNRQTSRNFAIKLRNHGTD